MQRNTFQTHKSNSVQSFQSFWNGYGLELRPGKNRRPIWVFTRTHPYLIRAMIEASKTNRKGHNEMATRYSCIVWIRLNGVIIIKATVFGSTESGARYRGKMLGEHYADEGITVTISK